MRRAATGINFIGLLRRRNATARPSVPAALSHYLSSPLSTSNVSMDRTEMGPSSSPSSSSSSERYSFHPTLAWNPEVLEYFSKAYGIEKFAEISKSLTHPSSFSSIRVNTLRTSADDIIKKLEAILDEKRLESSIDHLDIRRQNGAADVDALKLETHGPSVVKCPYPGLDNVVIVKGSGPHSVQYDDQSRQPMKEVIVSRKCAEAVLRGAQVFVPGVLACSSHVEKGDLVAVSVAVEQLLSDGGWGFGITRGSILQGLQSDPQYSERNGRYIGQGTTQMSRAGIFRASQGIAVEMTHRVYRLPSFHDVLEGEIFLQNLPSIVTAHVLNPQEGDRILDMCAAPGGKTTAIAILMRDKGEVVALDRSHNKVIDILKLAAEMGLTCINAYRLDALKSVCQIEETMDSQAKASDCEALGTVQESVTVGLTNGGYNVGTDQRRHICSTDGTKAALYKKNGPGRNNCKGGRVRNSKGFVPNSFDRVLLDAPCSALGLRPRLFAGEETLESLRNHAKYQRRMFDRAVQLVRPGGVIVYSTCTINPGENEALVRYALDKYKFLSLAPQKPRIGGPGLVGDCELFGGEFVEKWLTESEAELVQRFDPSSSLDTIGFFVAKFNVGQKDK